MLNYLFRLKCLHNGSFNALCEKRYFCSATTSMFNQDINNLYLANNSKHATNALPLSKSINPKIQKMIDGALNGRNIVDIINNHQIDIKDASIYNKAMQKCTFTHKDWKSAQQIMKMLIKSDTKPTVISFTNFINCMARSDFPDVCLQYFEMMIYEFKISPNVIVFGALLKSLRRQSKYKEAEKWLKIMKKEYKIKPNEFIYTEMLAIYAKAHKKRRAHKLFSKYLRSIKKHKNTAEIKVFGAYFSVFSQCGDIKGMEQALCIWNDYGFELDIVMVGDIMRGYNAARLYEKTLSFVDEWIGNGGSMNAPILRMKCIALGQMIHHRKNLSFEEHKKLFEELRENVFVIASEYGIKIDSIFVDTFLSGAVFLYRTRNPMEIVNIFKDLVDRQLIGYKCLHAKSKQIAIDLHGFSIWNAQFIIRYIFAFELDEFVNDDSMQIIVGKGKHRVGKGKDVGILREFIQLELMSWNPAVDCSNLENNDGTILIYRDQLSEYLMNDMNYCKQMFVNPTDICLDWYDEK